MQHYQAPDQLVHVINPDHAHLLPPGCVPITKEQAEAVHAANTPGLTDADVIEAKKTAVCATRESVLNRLVGIALAAQLTGDQATVDAYLIARQGLLDLTRDLPSDPQAAEETMLQRYQDVVQEVKTSAPGLLSAFAAMDQ